MKKITNCKREYLSYFLNSETPLYGGGKGVEINPCRQISKGDTANTTDVSLNNHAGTHIDFPKHFLDDGKLSQDFPASFWVFESPFMLECPVEEDELINLDEDMLRKIPHETDFLILKTGFWQYRHQEKYWKHNPGLAPDLGITLKENFPNLRVIGGDYISITAYQFRIEGRTAHRNFLSDPAILLVEDMDLRTIQESPKKIYCFPFQVEHLDGAPVTIIGEFYD